ncbi:hypothetical protein M0804_003315 [Polistes exclamans]|nr:hypothetical protein M0804_003315 [Polistes exclamans]
MKEVAALGKVSERALIEHIINGVVDEEMNKAILYQSRTLKELKRNIEIYDVMKRKSKASKTVNRDNNEVKRERRAEPPRILALVDSGSDLTLIREDKFREIEPVSLVKTVTRVKGAGNGNVRILGVFEDEVTVDDVVCKVKIHVVPENAMPYECILGKNFLSNVEIIIRGGKVVKMVRIREGEGKGGAEEGAEAVCVEYVMKGVFNITIYELDVKPQFAKEVERLVVDYKPAKQMTMLPYLLEFLMMGC